MKTILLTKRSPFQYYCANHLFNEKKLSEVIFESGQSTPHDKLFKVTNLKKTITQSSLELLYNPKLFANNILRKTNSFRYYGRRPFHENRILNSQHQSLINSIHYKDFDSVNTARCIEYIKHSQPNLVYVFGTGIISESLISAIKCPIINLHWGWSPNYRGEGIVSALSKEGVSALGVTIHLLTQGIDSGDIISRDRIDVTDKEDNFYSIGLKLTVIGVRRFAECFDRVEQGETLSGIPQDLDQGELFTSKIMHANPQLFFSAWRNLKLKN
jgi:folate-dependent phosphoribosylglycinamide formyltransferase PurN